MLVSFLLLLSGCGSIGDRGMTASVAIDEISKEEVKSAIETGNYSSIKTLLDDNFSLVDVVSEGNNEQSYIYATRQFGLEELSPLIERGMKAEQVSDIQENKQIFIYSNYILTLQEDQEDPELLLLELASTEFVRNHYTPNYFSGFFALWLLDDVLDVDDWGKKRTQACKQGNCYGGYYNTDKYRSGDIGSLRGSTTRGGGPGTGK